MPYDMSIHTNPDAMAWTKFFRECNPDCNVDDDIMLGWFANSMMAMHDYLLNIGPINGDHVQYLMDSENNTKLHMAVAVDSSELDKDFIKKIERGEFIAKK